MNWEVRQGDCLQSLRAMEAGFVQAVVTSPPYWGLRSYDHAGQIGLEVTREAYVKQLVEVFREVRRVMKDDGTMWLNLGDCFKNKQLQGIPWRVALALQDDGWWLRSDIIWQKKNPMPSSVKDRPVPAHEYLFLLAKSSRYFYDYEAVKEPATGKKNWNKSRSFDTSFGRPTKDNTARGIPWKGSDKRNRRTVWTLPTQPYKGAHFAVMPPKLIEPCVRAGSRVGDLILDPFSGAATVGVVALRNQRRYIGLELNPDYCELSRKRLSTDSPLLAWPGSKEDLSDHR